MTVTIMMMVIIKTITKVITTTFTTMIEAFKAATT